ALALLVACGGHVGDSDAPTRASTAERGQGDAPKGEEQGASQGSTAGPSRGPAPTTPASPGSADCTNSFAEITDGTSIVRYELGRELFGAGGTRGSTRAYAEYRDDTADGMGMLDAEALKQADGYGGYVDVLVQGIDPAAIASAGPSAPKDF